MKISLFASAVKPHAWPKLFDSLKSNTVEYEVVFSGYIYEDLLKEVIGDATNIKYITTENIKPAQCYEIARRACTGEIVGWISDDCVFQEGALDKICARYRQVQEEIVYPFILAIKNFDPKCENNELNDQRFYSRNLNTPQMAQIGFMSREQLENMGGFDNRYVYGKWESDICMRLIAGGGKVIKCEDIQVEIEHTQKTGHVTNDWSGVNEDGEFLENSWVIGGYKGIPNGMLVLNDKRQLIPYWPITNNEVTLVRNDKFQPYSDSDLTKKSEGYNIPGRWV